MAAALGQQLLCCVVQREVGLGVRAVAAQRGAARSTSDADKHCSKAGCASHRALTLRVRLLVCYDMFRITCQTAETGHVATLRLLGSQRRLEVQQRSLTR